MLQLTARRGDTFFHVFSYEDISDNAVDLTGYAVTFSTTINGVTTLYSEGGGVTVDDETGTITVTIDEANTALWGTSGTYRIKITSGGGNPTVTTIDSGNLRVE